MNKIIQKAEEAGKTRKYYKRQAESHESSVIDAKKQTAKADEDARKAGQTGGLRFKGSVSPFFLTILTWTREEGIFWLKRSARNTNEMRQKGRSK
jgi:hypothetical protein